MIFLKNNQCAVRALYVMTGEMLSQTSGNPTQLPWPECPWVAQQGIVPQARPCQAGTLCRKKVQIIKLASLKTPRLDLTGKLFLCKATICLKLKVSEHILML